MQGPYSEKGLKLYLFVTGLFMVVTVALALTLVFTLKSKGTVNKTILLKVVCSLNRSAGLEIL
jgi:hypothetical protein